MVKYLAILLLTGCACKPVIEYRYVKMPEPVRIERPAIIALNIDESQDAGTVIQLHRETIKVLQGYAKELEVALDAYRSK
jgi:hypothetical protein